LKIKLNEDIIILKPSVVSYPPGISHLLYFLKQPMWDNLLQSLN